MKAIIFYEALFFLTGMISCKHDNVADIVTPSQYFPAYPGSYWVYSNNDTLKVDRYVQYRFNAAAYGADADYKTLLLPRLILNGIYNGSDQYAYVNGYSISKPYNSWSFSYDRDPAFIGLLSETYGARFIRGGALNGGHQELGQTLKVDTSITIGTTTYNQVIMVAHFDNACFLFHPSENCYKVREYYAKDVGLIKRENATYPGWATDIELVKYHIAK